MGQKAGRKSEAGYKEEKMTSEILAKEEAENMRSLLRESGVKETKISLLETIIDNTAWMKIRLDEARKAVKESTVAIPYDNGGGQAGIRENPLFKGYESLFKSYMSGMNKILDCLPAETLKIDEETKPENVLSIIRARHRKQA